MDASPVKHTIDIAAGLGAVATVLGWLPAFSAMLSAIWFGIQIYEYIKRKRAK